MPSVFRRGSTHTHTALTIYTLRISLTAFVLLHSHSHSHFFFADWPGCVFVHVILLCSFWHCLYALRLRLRQLCEPNAFGFRRLTLFTFIERYPFPCCLYVRAPCACRWWLVAGGGGGAKTDYHISFRWFYQFSIVCKLAFVQCVAVKVLSTCTTSQRAKANG